MSFVILTKGMAWTRCSSWTASSLLFVKIFSLSSRKVSSSSFCFKLLALLMKETAQSEPLAKDWEEVFERDLQLKLPKHDDKMTFMKRIKKALFGRQPATKRKIEEDSSIVGSICKTVLSCCTSKSHHYRA